MALSKTQWKPRARLPNLWTAVTLLLSLVSIYFFVVIYSHQGSKAALVLASDRPNSPLVVAPDPPKRTKYPPGVGRKFTLDGKVLYFPGNTIISHLSPSNSLYASMLILYDKLEASPLSHLYTLLPPSSWHMTIFEGVVNQTRRAGYWPSDLDVSATLEECNNLFEKKLKVFNLTCDPPYLMKIVGWSGLKSGISITVEARTIEEDTRLRALRDRLADTLQIKQPDHATYRMHLSMAYLLRWLTEAQKKELIELLMGHFEEMSKEFELGAPEFCTFENMFAFQRQFYLKDVK